MNKAYWWTLAFVCLVSVLALTPVGLAQTLGENGSSVVDNATVMSDVEKLFDRVIPSQLAEGDIAGATVAVVSEGKVILNKGYGVANVSAEMPVDPDRTLFRVGCVSKLFVWTAVMQLVEKGQLDLQTDVNEYLDFEIPHRLHGNAGTAAVTPITLAHLMTHSAGFEDVPANLFHLRAEQTIPLDEYIRTHVPARVFPPGELSSYSNYGSALAGYIVERVSGLPFAQYVEENIFAPLGMNRSTFSQPVEAALSQDVAKGYRFIDGQFVEGDFVYALGPAGGMSSTAADMARFMLAHLNGGMLDGQRILSETTVAKMHSPLFSQHPVLDGMAHGFLERSHNGRRVLYHMGSVLIFNSGMYLLPEEGVGLFVSYNGGSHLQPMELFKEFMYVLYSGADEPAVAAAATLATGVTGARPFVGEYQINRRSYTTDASILSLLEAVWVDVDAEGHLLVTHMGQKEKFVEIEPGMFRNVAPDSSLDPYGAFRTIVFNQNAAGQTVLLSDGPMSYTKAPWYATGVFTLGAVLITVLLLMGSGMVWGVRAVIRRFRRHHTSQRARVATVYRAVAATFAVVTVAFLVGVLTISGDMEPAYGVPKSYFGIEPGWASLLKAVPWLMLALGGAMTVCTVVAWQRKYWTVGGRIHYTLVNAGAVVLLAVLRFWHVF